MPNFMTRADSLDVHEVPDGYIIYQPACDKVHYLNKTAAVIFEFCDGRRERSDVVSRVATAFELPEKMHEEITVCLENLIKEGLIQELSTSSSGPFTGA
jgi:hypothetical protein